MLKHVYQIVLDIPAAIKWYCPIIRTSKVKDSKQFDKQGEKLSYVYLRKTNARIVQQCCAPDRHLFNESRPQDGSNNFRVAQQAGRTQFRNKISFICEINVEEKHEQQRCFRQIEWT